MKALAEAAGRAFEEVRRGASGEAPFAVAPHLLRRQLRGLGGGLDYRGVVEMQPCTVASNRPPASAQRARKQYKPLV